MVNRRLLNSILVTEHGRQYSEEIKHDSVHQQNMDIRGNIIEEIGSFQRMQFAVAGDSRNINNSMFGFNENDRLVYNLEEANDGVYQMNLGFQTLSDSNMRRNNSTVE